MISWLGHAGFLIADKIKIYIDPYGIKVGMPKADIVLITHEHFDHCSAPDIEKIMKPGTYIVTNARAIEKLSSFDAAVEIVSPGNKLMIGDTLIQAVPAYNISKVFHPKRNEGLGFVVKVSGQKIYHAGDTDLIDEMSQIKCDTALLPVSGTYVMTPEEAAAAAERIKPNLVIPMHYGSVVGTIADANRFVGYVSEKGINTKLLVPQ